MFRMHLRRRMTENAQRFNEAKFISLIDPNQYKNNFKAYRLRDYL